MLYLRPSTTSALIGAMRTAKLIITTVLALQLIVTTGPCGGVCCGAATVRTDHDGSESKENNEPATAEKIESGHCPMHAAKKAMPGSRERHQSKTAQQPADAHHQRHQTRSSSTIESHLCACSVKRDEDLFEALAPRSPDHRQDVQNLPGASNPARWSIESSSAEITAAYSSRSHSPPFHGRQLQLRI